MFNFISHLFSSDPEKKEKRRAEKEERDRLRAQKKHNQRIASKQVLSDEWHPVNFPYQATIFNIQRANKGYGSTCQISARYIENEQYKDMIYLVNPKVKSFSFSNYHDIKPEDVADAPAFKDVWPKLEPYFTGKNVITYYADAHLRSLQATLKRITFRSRRCASLTFMIIFVSATIAGSLSVWTLWPKSLTSIPSQVPKIQKPPWPPLQKFLS